MGLLINGFITFSKNTIFNFYFLPVCMHDRLGWALGLIGPLWGSIWVTFFTCILQYSDIFEFFRILKYFYKRLDTRDGI